jgi:hypothetical protein
VVRARTAPLVVVVLETVAGVRAAGDPAGPVEGGWATLVRVLWFLVWRSTRVQ